MSFSFHIKISVSCLRSTLSISDIPITLGRQKVITLPRMFLVLRGSSWAARTTPLFTRSDSSWLRVGTHERFLSRVAYLHDPPQDSTKRTSASSNISILLTSWSLYRLSKPLVATSRHEDALTYSRYRPLRIDPTECRTDGCPKADALRVSRK